MNDRAATQLQETGQAMVWGMTLAEINALVATLGIDPATTKIDARGYLYVAPDERDGASRA